MAWQDDPVQTAWQDDPVSQPASVNPFNRQMGADVSYGAPLPGQIRNERDLTGEFRAAAGGPVMDRAAAALQTYLPQSIGGTGQDYAANLERNRAVTSDVQAQHPASAAAGTVAGALPLLAVPGVGGAGVGAGIRGGAIAGGLAGAAGSPDWSDPQTTARDALTGALLGGAVGGAVNKGVGALMPRAVEAGVPTLETIGPMKTAAYAEAKGLGAEYSPEAFKGLIDKITADAAIADIDTTLHPKAFAAIARLNREANLGKPVTLERLDQMRQAIGRDVSGASEPGERFFGKQLKGSIDEFIAGAGPSHMVSGSGPEAAAAISRARDLAQRQFKADDVTEALSRAELRAGSTASGDNLDNATRQNLRRAFESGNFTPDEVAQYSRAITGGLGQNALRRVGNMLNPSGLIGLGEIAYGAGALGMGSPGHAVSPLAAALLGYSAKKASGAMTRANTNELMRTILRGGVKPKQRPRAAAPPAVSRAGALAAALAGGAL